MSYRDQQPDMTAKYILPNPYKHITLYIHHNNNSLAAVSNQYSANGVLGVTGKYRSYQSPQYGIILGEQMTWNRSVK